MKNAFLTIVRLDHEVEVEVTPENPGLGYVVQDVPQLDESGEKEVGMLFLADEGIPLTILEEEESRELLEEANSPRKEDDFDEEDYDEPLSKRDQDRAADAYFGDRLGRWPG